MKKILPLFMVLLMISLSLIALLPVNGTSYSPPEMVERADVAPAYIANQTIVIELYGEYDVANIPQTGDINYVMQIISVFNGSVMESANATELNANWFYYYFNGIPAGFYYFYAYFTFNGINSPIMNISFIVHPPPVPYTAYWDGSTFTFHSDEYNLTGSYNASDPFTIELSYQYQSGQSETMGVYTNVTNLTIPTQNLGQNVLVNVIDKYRWENSNNINFADLQFVGAAYEYSYEPTPQPQASLQFTNIGIAVAIIVVGIVMIFVLTGNGKREERYD